MNAWINNPSERRVFADKLREKQWRNTVKKEREHDQMELQNIDDTWKAACEEGKLNGRVILCWLDMKQIGNRVYTFQSDYGHKLQDLRLDGIGLTSLGHLSSHCRDLEKLSLASNSIRDVGNSDIHYLSKLTHLNLLRNQLTHLPATIGLLTNLTRLDLANNLLTELPAEMSSLRGLTQLNLECNELSELPNSFGKLECEVINLNSNKFKVCPPCIVDMKNLEHLSIIGNELGCLPSGMHRLKKLEVLRASKNRLTCLPDSIVDISKAKCMWFDFNKLSALPPNFHRLTKLKELKLDGNIDMVYPPIQIASKGTEEVLRWSRNRLEMGKSARVRLIVQSIVELLNQVQRYRIGGPLHESVFAVIDDQFQFPPNALWSIFIPELTKIWSDPSKPSNDGIKSFPYERTEVEQAMFQFRDAAGPIVRTTSHAIFRRCSCIQTGQSTVVCVPPKIGWMCTRPALLMRKECYEENMREKRRALAEEKSILDAEREARNIARSFLSSDEGIIAVRNEAIKRLSLLTSADSSNRSLADKMFKVVPRSIISGLKSKRMLKRVEDEIKKSYISDKVTESRNGVIDRNTRVRLIVQRWMGLSLFDAYEGWRNTVELARKQRRREQRIQLKEERLRFEDDVARYEFEKIDISKWVESWDEFNDVPIWIHALTNESRYEKPTLRPYPSIPKSLIDPTTGFISSQQETHQNEADSDSDVSSDAGVVRSGKSKGGKDFISDSIKIFPSEAPKGKNSEVDMARNRVLQLQRAHVKIKYKI